MTKKKKPPKKPSELNLAPALPPLADIDFEYQQCLGMFIEEYAHAEALVFLYLIHTINLSVPMGRALFSGVRVKEALGLIGRVWEIEPPSPSIKEDLDEVFQHLSIITGVRNSIMHYSYMSDEQVRTTSDVTRAHTVERIRQIPVPHEALFHMGRDLLKIGMHMMAAISLPDSSFDERAVGRDLLHRAWLYKQPSTQKQKRRKPSTWAGDTTAAPYAPLRPSPE